MNKFSSKRILSLLITLCLILSSFAVITASAYDRFSLKSDSKLVLNDNYDGTFDVLNFPESKTLKELLSNFENADQIKAYKNGASISLSDKVSNGILLYIDDANVTVIIKGDTTGDGVINSTDYLQVKSYFLGKYDFLGNTYKAADCNDDKIINSTDYLQIKQYLLKEFNLYPDYFENDTSDDTSSEESSEDFSNETSEESSVEVSEESSEEPSVEVSEESSEEPSVEISEESSEVSSSEDVEPQYVLNVKTKKIHIPSCNGVKTMNTANREDYNGDINVLLEKGYKICGTCNAGQTEESSEAPSEESSVESSEPSSPPSSEESSEESSEPASEEYTVVTEPQVDTAYKFALNQATKGQILYFAGEMNNFYLATTEDKSLATDVYLENTEGGYYFYFIKDSVKYYINIVERDDAAGKVTIKTEETASTVYTFDSALNILVTTVTFADSAQFDFYLGTYNSFVTISASKTSYIKGDNESKIGVSQFPAYLVTVNA